LFKLANIPRIIWNTKRGHYINFLKISIQEDIFNIKLSEIPLTNQSYYNKNMNSSHFCKSSKCLLIIHTILLRVSFCNQSTFVLLNRSIRISLDLIHPTTTNNTLIKRLRNQILSIYVMQSRKFLIHSLLPKRIKNCLFIGRGLNEIINRS